VDEASFAALQTRNGSLRDGVLSYIHASAENSVEKRELERHYDAATSKTKGSVTSPTVGVVTQADAIQFVNALAAYATLPVLTPTAEFVLHTTSGDHVGYGHESTGADVGLYGMKLLLYGEVYALYECLGVCAESAESADSAGSAGSSVTYVLLFMKPGRVLVKKTEQCSVVPDKKPRITKVRGVVTKLLSGAVAPAPTPLASTTTMPVTPIPARTTKPQVPQQVPQHLLCYMVHFAAAPEASGYYAYLTRNTWCRRVSSSESGTDSAFLRIAGTQGTFGVSLGNRALRQLTLGSDMSDAFIVQLTRPTARPTGLPSEVEKVINATGMVPFKFGAAEELFGVWTTPPLVNGTSLCVSKGAPHTGGPYLYAEYIAYGIGVTGDVTFTVTYLWYIDSNSGKKVYFAQPAPAPAPGGSAVSWLGAPTDRRVLVVVALGDDRSMAGTYVLPGATSIASGASLEVFVRRADSSVGSTEMRATYDRTKNTLSIEKVGVAGTIINASVPTGWQWKSAIRPVSGAFVGARRLILWDMGSGGASAGASAMRSYVFTALGAYKDVYLCPDVRGEAAYLTVSGFPHEGGPAPPVDWAKWRVYVQEGQEGNAPKRLAYRAYYDEDTKTWMFKDKTSAAGAAFSRVQWLLCVDRK
jgi:hypothetical protein